MSIYFRSKVFTTSFLLLYGSSVMGASTEKLGRSRFQAERNIIWTNFVSDVISAHFSDCTMVVTSSGDFVNSLELIRSEIQNLISSIEIPNFQVSLTSLALKLDLNGNKKAQKFASHCKIVVSVVTAVKEPTFSESFFKLLTPTNDELTRRDQDHYIFVASEQTLADSILTTRIFNLLRYRIVLHGRSSNLIAKSFCLHCPGKQIRFTSTYALGNLQTIFPDFTWNYHKRFVRASGPTKYVPMYEIGKLNGVLFNKRGVIAEIANDVATKLNLTYFVEPCRKFGNIPEGSTGVLLPNGSWAGCVGDVYRNWTDIAFLVSPDVTRFHLVEFSTALDYSFVTFTTSKPILYHSWRSIFSAFDKITWVFLSASVVLTTFTSYKVDRNQFLKYSFFERISRTGLHLFGYLVGQDLASPKPKLSSRMIYISWLYYGLIVGAAYGSSLQALIVSPNKEYVPKTFLELAKAKNFRWGAAKGFRNGLGEQLFKTSDNPMVRKLYHKMEADDNAVSCQAKELDSKYACLDWEVALRFIMELNFKDKRGFVPFQFGTEAAFSVPITFITQKREIFRSHFNVYIARAFDTGLSKAMRDFDWMRFRGKLLKVRKQNPALEEKVAMMVRKTTNLQGGDLDSVKGCFFIMFFGVLASVCVLLVEKSKSL